MFFHSWTDVLRVFAVGAPAYAILIVLLRVSGKRTLSKLNAFDLVITVAMGSTLATILLSRDVSLVEGVAAMLLLVLLQFIITWTSVRSDAIGRLIKSEPTLVFYRDQFLEAARLRERLTQEELLAAARNHGFPDLSAVGAIVLETDGSLTAIGQADTRERSTLQGVNRRPAEA